MMERLYDIAQSIFSRMPASLEQIETILMHDGKLMERLIEGLAFILLFVLVLKLRKSRAVLEDGWFYLTPGFLAKFILVGSLLITLATVSGLVIALRSGYRPRWDLHGIAEFSPVVVLIIGFGTIAAASYRAYFKRKIRWNHTYIEKVTSRGTTRIAWKDVQDVIEKKESGYFLISSGAERIRVWSHMNGVPQLVDALAGRDEALGLLRQLRSSTASWKGALPSAQVRMPH
jgi:hypothetical protein